MLAKTDIFSVRRSENGSFELLAREEKVGTCSERLEAQFAVSSVSGTHYLLFLTDSCPYEEILEIRLLSPLYEWIDTVPLGFFGLLGVPGILRKMRAIQPNQVEFSFFTGEDDRWLLTVGQEHLRPEMPRHPGPMPRPRMDKAAHAPVGLVEKLPFPQTLKRGIYGAIAGFKSRADNIRQAASMAPLCKKWEEDWAIWKQRVRVLHLMQTGGAKASRPNPTVETDARKSDARGSL